MLKQKLILFLILLTGFWLKAENVSANIISYKKEADGVSFSLDKGLMKIKVCRDDIIEVKYTILKSFSQSPSLVVNNNWASRVGFTVTESDGNVVINTGALKVVVNKITEAITYTTITGKVITAEDKTENKSMLAATIAGINTYNCTTQFCSPQDEALFGLGCHPVDSLSINYKGRNQDMAIKYMTGAIPVLLSTKGYGLLWDNYSASNFYGAEANNTKFKYVSESGKQIDYYFFYGPDFDHIIDLYRKATGKAPMFPKWSFGLFQSQDRYMSQQEILKVKDNYRNNHIPVDAIVQDWYYWDPLPIGSHVMNPERYPDPKALVDELHKANLHAMISIWPVFGKGTHNFDALKSRGYLTNITWDNVVTRTFDTYYDAHNPKARDLYWEQARDSLVKCYGWDAWWVDQCEPDNGALLDERRKDTFYSGRGIDYFNTYSLEHTKGIYGGWRKDIPGKRAFFLVRQAFAGQQRNATTLWSSDISCTFASYKIQVPQGINACASGIPYWTSDIGGYHLNWKAADWSKPENRELFTRWFQFGTFCPIFRIHGKGERALFSDNWDAKTKAILLNYDKLRYRLLPYIYSLAGKVTTDNYTMMRALSFDFRNDPKVYSIADQYMFGPAFLVNPVTEQLYTGSNAAAGKITRSVYLPAATQWYDFWTGKKYEGGQTLDAASPIDIMPLYVKAGSIIPMGPDVEYATEKPGSPIELRIYPGTDGIFKFYEDENDNYDYEKGAYATFTLSWDDKNHSLTISDTQGKFPGMLKTHKFNVVLVNEQQGTNLKITAQANKVVQYEGKRVNIKL
ncbi:alpha-D-xyloside xylohydrolase [Mucilaginibacter lappiensis]|uniref:Alpha-D-xyloside xylohydrolase n=1 Tax=Mucilaginibacter lappiensis TaxID=354630 RepID=A0ABR6PSZ9_9SPHI|nr:glycoside hydrolase family 31 protein [Mucilaginibacter lappiensis]MBB6112913.1 alpha-D-xyloside xylohydrolase [Mucilaginibacter lappiensis]SIS09189.1 alpha-D-xyloside xylohydrolase [Mucilaginibacter lappiensis]